MAYPNFKEVLIKILAIISGEYGQRHVDNIRERGPKSWEIELWRAPAIFPPVTDYPEDYLPMHLGAADLVLSFAENKGVAELLPDICQMAGAQAVIAAIDNEAWLPRGLARQLRGWLADMGVALATPKPLCALTEDRYWVARRKEYPIDHPLIAEFARYFGRPEIDLTIDPGTRTITSAQVERDAVCGCASFTAEKLVGVSVDDAIEKAGLLHHHFPCLASMGVDVDYGDTLMHVSGNLLKDALNEQVKPFTREGQITPPGMVSRAD